MFLHQETVLEYGVIVSTLFYMTMTIFPRGKNQSNSSDIVYIEYESNLRSNEHYLSSSENKAWKKFKPVRDLNPWPLRYRYSALPTELTRLSWFQINPWSGE